MINFFCTIFNISPNILDFVTNFSIYLSVQVCFFNIFCGQHFFYQGELVQRISVHNIWLNSPLYKVFLYFYVLHFWINFLTIIWMKGNVCEGGGYIISVVIFSFVYNASKFLEFETTYYQEVELFKATSCIFYMWWGDILLFCQMMICSL